MYALFRTVSQSVWGISVFRETHRFRTDCRCRCPGADQGGTRGDEAAWDRAPADRAPRGNCIGGERDHALSIGHPNLESSMTIQRFDTGPRMSQVVVHGDTIYLAGVVANTAAGKSVTEQTKEVLSIIDIHLAKAGSDKSNLLTATNYLPDMGTFAEMNAVWDGWVSPGNTPARATVQARLAAPQYTVEIMVTAGQIGRAAGR